MSISTTTNKVFYTGDGAMTTPFDFSFPVFAVTDLEVYVDGVLKTLTTHYSVTLTATNTPGEYTGTVTFVTAPPDPGVGEPPNILIRRKLALTQPTVLPTEGALPAKTVEKMDDRATMLLQQLQEELDRALQLPATYSETFDVTLPDTLTPRRALMINTAGDGLELSTYDPDTQISAATAQAAAAATSAAAALVSQNAAAASAAAAAASANDAATSAAAAAASASSMVAATIAETLTGTNAVKYISADALAAIWEKGTDIASAATLTIPATGGGYFDVTGTTTVTAVSQAANRKEGRLVRFRFTGSLVLTHNATSLALLGSANITTQSGDHAIFVCSDANNNYWRMVDYIRADGSALGGSTFYNYFGDGSDGAYNSVGNTTLAVVADAGPVVKQYTSFTLNAGHTYTLNNRHKGLVIYCSGDVNISGTLSMTKLGASAAGAAINMKKYTVNGMVSGGDSTVISNESNQMVQGLTTWTIPAAGANGGSAVNGAGQNGTAGTNGQTGGGGSGGGGSTNAGNLGGAGAAGTSYSGGAGGGGTSRPSGGGGNAGAANGGAGGAGTSGGAAYVAGGGAGNPGGAGAGTSGGVTGAAGESGTGGAIIIVAKGNVTINGGGKIEANGGIGGGFNINAVSTEHACGAGSGGGTILILYGGTYTNNGTVQANGGSGTPSTAGTARVGGNGGAGSIQTAQISSRVA